MSASGNAREAAIENHPCPHAGSPTFGGGIAPVNKRYADPPAGAAARMGRWFLRAVGQVRRQYISRLRPGYVARVRAEREGQCRGCGSCCDLTFRCPFLNAESRCTIYEKRTRTCRDFPIDAVDLKLTGVPCGHSYGSAGPKGADRANSAG